ncbi:MAG TPA: RNA polymerase sigma factor [Cellvibrionaceae bacterium]|nr:RNA polymerase sigma factor [Cellvibrionaceae bacterium]
MQPVIDWTEFLTAAAPLQPMLHKYCARLLGSVTDGEDLLQDTLIKAFTAQNAPTDPQQLRAWLFKIAHNRAIDLLRAKVTKNPYSLEQMAELSVAADYEDSFVSNDADPLQQLIQQETLAITLGAFVQLPIAQRSVVILKDVLGEPLADIASLLGLTLDSVKSHLARGRRNLSVRRGVTTHEPPAPSAQLAQYVALFNQRDWPALKQLLSSEVILKQSSHPERRGTADVSSFFSIYAGCDFGRLKAAWLDGREVILVYPPQSAAPKYLMWLEWQHNKICFIRDYRYVDYLLDEMPLINLVLA